MDSMKFGQKVQFSIDRAKGNRFTNLFRRKPLILTASASALAAGLAFGGIFDVDVVRGGEGLAKGLRDTSLRFPNGVVNQGLNKILNVQFQSATQITTWYLDLIATGATLAAADTYASHAGWSYTTGTNYSNATRPTWAPAASTAQSSTNSSTVDFTIVATCTIYGIAVVAGSSTKADSASGSGVLWATGAFPGGEQSLVNGDTLKVTYTVNASAS